jgi:hypothetical protein
MYVGGNSKRPRSPKLVLFLLPITLAAPALGTLGTVSILGVGQKILAIAK